MFHLQIQPNLSGSFSGSFAGDGTNLNLASNSTIPASNPFPLNGDAVITGSRSFGWRSDKGSTIYYVEALDDGNPRKKVSYRDKVFTLNSPFNGNPKELIKLELRYSSIYWGDEKTALVSARKWTERRTTTWHVNPSNGKNRKIIDVRVEDTKVPSATP